MENLFSEIIEEKNPTLKKEIAIQTQETLRVPKQPSPNKDLSMIFRYQIYKAKKQYEKLYGKNVNSPTKPNRIISIPYQQL